MESLDPLAANVSDARPFRPQHPLMSVRRKRVDGCRLQVEREDSERLNRVHKEEDVAPAAEFAESVEVVTESAGELNAGDGQHPRADVHRGATVISGDPAAAAGDATHLDAT